jgi:SnoaL-like domain
MESMNREQYDAYVRAFNAKDYDAVADFYVDPPHMSFFGVDIRSRADLKRFYSFLHSYVNESVTVTRFAASDELTAIDAIVRIEAYRDLDAATLEANGCGGFFPIKKGKVQELRQFIFYVIKDGKIERVECAMPLA